jgi:GT2 family glycosyltransferase
MIQHLPNSTSESLHGPGTVSVVVVNWNRRELLLACLRSLLAPQGVPFEVVLVDNGSTDGSVEAVQGEDWPFPLRVLRNERNRGFCGANNQGIEASRAEFIALLNNDAEAESQFLAHLRAAFDRGPRVGMAAAKILVWEDPRLIDKVGHLIWLDGQNRGRGAGEVDQGQYDAIQEALWPDGCACMYRRSMLEEIGGFDEDLFAYGDDAELGLRARIAGWHCWLMPQAVVRHHRGATLGLASSTRLRLIERNRVLLAAKLFPGTLLWLNGAYHLARLAAGAKAALLNRGEISRFSSPKDKLRAILALLQGQWEALWMLPRTWRKRRQFRPLHRLNSRQIRQLLNQYRIPLRTLSEQAIPPLPPRRP